MDEADLKLCQKVCRAVRDVKGVEFTPDQALDALKRGIEIMREGLYEKGYVISEDWRKAKEIIAYVVVGNFDHVLHRETSDGKIELKMEWQEDD